MKKILSLFCAMAIVFSASAAPQLQAKSSFAKTDRTEKKAVELKKFVPAVKFSNAAKAPQAKQTTTNVVASKATSTFYASENDVFYSLYNEDKSIVFCFDIVCATGDQDVVSGQTYTLANMLADYCEWVYSSDIYNGTAFTAASFKKTVANDGSFTIEASATDANGDIWNITYAESAFVPQTYNVTIEYVKETYYSEDNDVYLVMRDKTGSDYNYSFIFDIVVGEGKEALESGKTYTLNDMIANYSKGTDYVNMEYVTYSTASVTKTIAADQSYTIVAQVLDTKGNTWNLTYTKAAPQDKNITFSMKDMDFNMSETYWEMSGKDPNTNYYLSIRSKNTTIAGTYAFENLDDFYTYVGTGNQVFYDIESANIVVTYENNVVAITGTMKFVNDGEYINATLNIAADYDGLPHLVYDAKNADFIVDFPNPTINTSYVADYGVLYVLASNEDLTTIALEFNVATTTTALAAGVYDITATGAENTVTAGQGLDEDSYLVGSYAGNKNSQGQITTPLWWLVSGTVTVAENGVITVDAINSYDRVIKCKLGQADPTAVVNANVAVKAIKSIENGQLIIRANGKNFNAQGVEIR